MKIFNVKELCRIHKVKILLILSVLVLVAIIVQYTRSQKQLLGYLLHNKAKHVRVTISPEFKKTLENLKFPYNIKSEKKIIVINLAAGLGDAFASKRIQEAALNLGWESVIIAEAHKSPKENNKIIEFLKPSFVISQTVLTIVNGIPNYLIIHTPPVLKTGEYYEKFKDYSGFLFSAGDDRFIKLFANDFLTQGKKFFYEYFYFSSPENYSLFQPIDHKRLFFSGDKWDQRRGGEEYEKFFNLLCNEGYFDVYGPEGRWDGYKCYKGFLPFDTNTYLNAMRKSGIALVIHSNLHYENNLPSARIFEAAASSAVIISDDLKFVKDNFGDNVLYIDPSLPAEDLFKQVDNHVKWIQANPEKAQEMAYNSNKIYQEKFVLEKMLLNVEKLHERVMQQEKK